MTRKTSSVMRKDRPPVGILVRPFTQSSVACKGDSGRLSGVLSLEHVQRFGTLKMNNLPQTSISHPAATGRFIAIAFALAVTMAGATLASPLYPLYEHAFGITSAGVTIVYSSYMAGALVALLLLGHLSDHVGFVHALRIAVALLLAGLVISAVAHALPVLAIGRFAIGIAAGTASSAATAGLVALEPAWKVKRAALVGSIMNIAGLGLGPVAGGVVAQILPHPLLTPYAVFGVSALLALVALAIHPADAEVQPIRHFRPALRFHVPTLAAVRPFAIASITTFTGYTLFSLFASLAPAFLSDLLPWHGPAVAGTGVATLFVGSAIAQFTLRKVDSRRGLTFGALSIGASVVLMAASLPLHSGILFVASDLIGGFGQGLAFMSAVAVVNQIAPPANRARMISSFFSIAYLGGIVPIVGLGLLADRIGLDSSIGILSVVLGLLTIALGILAHRSSKTLGHA
ncbi:MFS transporter [Paraburkholderia sediminicola]|uniref:MFS transporter n=1 Tax=Paraburkholderia sediminicola TaxID=458836 RepID=UPI000E74DE6F